MPALAFNAFVMNTASHIQHGQWRHPDAQQVNFNDVNLWVDLARTLERGRFDGVFIADSIGAYDVYGASPDATVKYAAQFPKYEPLSVIPIMAYVTEHLGFGGTVNLTFESPFLFARRMSTLDHLTGGRMGWNIVTGFLAAGAKAAGQTEILAHDARYDFADEFLSITYRLWEQSWEDDALLADKDARVFADPAKVHMIEHKGQYLQMRGLHMTDPSPQRTPVLYQAGASARGRIFGATHAECIFINGPSKQGLARTVKDMREAAVSVGRRPDDLRFFLLATAIVGRTTDEAKAKYEEYKSYINVEASLALFSGTTGIDLSRYGLDEPIPNLEKEDAVQSAIKSFTSEDPTRIWTLRQVAEHMGIGGRGPIFVGTAHEIADAMEEWVDETDADGFNLSYAILPEGFADVADLVVPELQRRGRFKEDYSGGTLREKLFGAGQAFLPERHVARKWRARPAA